MRTMKKTDGFTLVELIVVIAILAILAAVAIPAYSGYVEKAQRAGDEQLLVAINKAYASACLENGTDMALLDGASMPLNADKTVKVEGVAPYGQEFALYYEGNEASAFQVFETIVFCTKQGKFCNIEDAQEIAVTINGKTYYGSGADVNAYLNSTIGKTMTSGEVTGLAAETADAVFDVYSGTYVSDLLKSDSYKDAINDMFGMSYEDYEKEQFEKWAAANTSYDLSDDFDYGDALNEWRNSDSGKKQFDQNLMILTSVNQAGQAGETILTDLRNGTAKQTIINNLTGGSSGEQAALGLSQSALAYGLYVSFAGSNATVTDFTAALGDPNSKFSKYLQKDQAETDLAGVLAAMNVVSQQNKESLDSVVANGVDKDTDLAEALQQILGK